MKNILIKFRYSILSFAKFIMFGIMVGLFAFVYLEQYQEATLTYRANEFAILVYAVILFFFMRMYGGYNIGYLRKNELSYSLAVSCFFADAALYVIMCMFSESFLYPTAMIGLFIMQIIAGIILTGIFNRLYFYLYPARQVALVCHNKEAAQSIINKIKTSKDRYTLRCVLPDTLEYEKIIKVIKNFESVIIHDISPDMKVKLLDYCYSTGKRTYIVPTVQDLIMANSHMTQIFDTSAILCKNRGPSMEERIIKRLFDILVSLIGLICLSPIMLIVGMIIHFYDGGPAFFKQKRLTERRKVFTLYKFRSMRVDSEADGKARLATANDDRITPVGKFIRATRLDEIPQLINILKGDMSLVGPRPERPEIAEEYEKVYPAFKYRLKMKAGLTGYAQVNGRYNTSPVDKLILDLRYIQNFSLLTDLKILLKTIKVVFMPDSAEGFSEEKTDVSQIEFVNNDSENK